MPRDGTYLAGHSVQETAASHSRHAAFWLNPQIRYDLEEAERTLGSQLTQEVTPSAA